MHGSNPSKHINSHLDHIFTWSVICNAPTNKFKQKIMEAYFIAITKPTLNDQPDSDLLHLFKNGITILDGTYFLRELTSHILYILKIFYCNFINIFNFLVSTDDGKKISEKLLLIQF